MVNLHGWQSHEVKVILHSASPQGFSRAAEAFLSGARLGVRLRPAVL